MDTKKLFSDRLRSLRNSKGLSQKVLAEAMGITEAGYQNYEVGRRLPTFEKLLAICNALGCSADYLLGRTDKP
jgi:transcriptional regulator with XRE-family HTH domain